MESVKKKAKEHFETEKISFRGLAKKYGKSHTYWSNVAKEEKWEKFNSIPYEQIQDIEIVAKVGKMSEEEAYTIEDGKGLLSTIAIRKAKEILKELGDLYSSVDEPLIIQYILAYQRSIKLEREVQEQGETIISPTTGGKYMNPTYSALLACNAQLIKIGNDFGFSISSRTRNALDFGQKSSEPNIFDIIKNVLEE